jgi:hypothetical protein
VSDPIRDGGSPNVIDPPTRRRISLLHSRTYQIAIQDHTAKVQAGILTNLLTLARPLRAIVGSSPGIYVPIIPVFSLRLA